MGLNERQYRAAESRYWEVEGVLPTETWVRLPRIGTRVRIQVAGEGPPVLFVHGGSINGTCFAPLVARLSDFRCLVLDRPGCGLSERLPARVSDVATFAISAETLIVDVLDALEIEQADIVATSLGGYHALRTAVAHPSRIRRVLELGFPIGAPNGPMPFVMRLAGVRGVVRLMTRLPVSERAVRSMLAQIGLRRALAEGRVPQEGIEWFRALLRYTDTMKNDLDASPILHGLRGVNPAILLDDEMLGGIQVPMLFLWGAEDQFGGEPVARSFVAKVHGARLVVIPESGHVVWLDDPDGIAESTREFLAAPSVAHQGP